MIEYEWSHKTKCIADIAEKGPPLVWIIESNVTHLANLSTFPKNLETIKRIAELKVFSQIPEHNEPIEQTSFFVQYPVKSEICFLTKLFFE